MGNCIWIAMAGKQGLPVRSVIHRIGDAQKTSSVTMVVGGILTIDLEFRSGTGYAWEESSVLPDLLKRLRPPTV